MEYVKKEVAALIS